MATAQPVVIAGPSNTRLYAGKFGPAVVSGGAVLDGPQAAGTLATAAALSGGATMGDLAAAGGLGQNPATNLSGGATLDGVLASGQFVGEVAGATALASLAASMTVGQWATLSGVTGFNSTLFRASNGNTMLGYLDKACYAPTQREVLFIGQAHLGDQGLFRYDEAANSWAKLPDPPWDDGGDGQPSWIGHAYQGNALDPATGDLYYRRTGTSIVWRWIRASDTWVQLPTFTPVGGSIAGAIEWLPDFGSQGGLLYACDDVARSWDKASNTWTVRTPAGFNQSNHCVAVRSVPNGLVVFGAGNANNNIWTIDGAGTVDATHTACPINMGVNASISTACPVSGDILVVKGNGTGRSYNLATKTWTTMSGVPTFGTSDIDIDDVFAAPVSAHGVVLFCDGAAGVMHVYKHAASFTPFATATLNGGGAGKQWTMGVPVKRGDVPSSFNVQVAGATSWQVDVRNRWSDGSVKFAVASGVGGTALSFSKTPATETGAAVAAITAGDVGTTSVALSGVGTVTLADAINGTDLTSFAGTKAVRPASAGRLNVQHAGRVMREEHFYSPVGSFMAVLWYVRKYSNGAVEVEAVVENGWQFVTGGAAVTYDATLTVNGTVRFTGSAIEHRARTRWSRAYWVGTDPAVTPIISTTYLKSTALVPNYGSYGTASEAALNALPNDSAPFASAGWPATMGAAGYHGSIGLLPLWDAMFCTTGDVRAFNSVVAMGRSAGRYGMWFRNEATLQIDFNADGDTSTNSGSGAAQLATVTGTAAPAWADTHQPSIGYLAYLLTGRQVMLETLAGAATGDYFQHDFFTRRGGARGLIYIGNESRKFAWTWRTLAQIAALAHDGSNLKTQAQFRWDENMTAWAKYWTGDGTHGIPDTGGSTNPGHTTAPNNLGCITSMESTKEDQAWMHAFSAAAVGYAWDLEPSSNATARGFHLTLRNKGYDLSTIYSLPPGNNYRFGTPYRPFWGPLSSTTWYSSWRVATDTVAGHITQYLAERDLSATGGPLYIVSEGTAALPAGTVFDDGGSGFAIGYQANSQAMLAYAATHGYATGAASWALFAGSSTYSTRSAEYADIPHFGVVPRA